MYIDGPVQRYLDDLAARKPSPGGGSAAALEGALGAGLISMVLNYTIGNPKYKSVEERAKELLSKAEGYRSAFARLVDEDVEAYQKLAAIVKLAKNDPKKLDDVYREAVKPPLEICRISEGCLRLCVELAEIGNKNLITDTAIAAIMLEGAFFAAKFNVYINLKYIKDMDHVGKIHNMLAPLEEEIPKLKEDILEKCDEVIAK